MILHGTRKTRVREFQDRCRALTPRALKEAYSDHRPFWAEFATDRRIVGQKWWKALGEKAAEPRRVSSPKESRPGGGAPSGQAKSIRRGVGGRKPLVQKTIHAQRFLNFKDWGDP